MTIIQKSCETTSRSWKYFKIFKRRLLIRIKRAKTQKAKISLRVRDQSLRILIGRKGFTKLVRKAVS